MGELLFQDSEGNPFYMFQSSEGKIIADTGNSTLFLHGVENAGVDHLFVTTAETEDNYQGIYLFRLAMNAYNPELFDQLASELQDADFDTMICDVPSEQDQEVFNRYIEPAFDYDERELEGLLDES